MSGNGGKGSGRRSSQVPTSTVGENWERIFGRKEEEVIEKPKADKSKVKTTEIELSGLCIAHNTILYDEDGIWIGQATCFINTDSMRLEISDFSIDNTKRRLGYGTLLEAAIIKKAADVGVLSIILNSVTSAVEFYEKLGYRKLSIDGRTVIENSLTFMYKEL